MKKILIAGLCCALLGTSLTAATMFDNISRLTSWRPAAPHSYAHVVGDPFTRAGKALAFSQSNAGADVYSSARYSSGRLHFEYMGTLSLPADGGGFVGISGGEGGRTTWLAGAGLHGQHQLALLNDGTWHAYSVPFDAAAISAGEVHVVLAQLAGGSADQAMFRNLSVADEASPLGATTPALFASLAGIGLFGYIRRRKAAPARVGVS